MTMYDNLAIQMDNVSKLYKLYTSLSDRLFETLSLRTNTNNVKEFYALKDINFSIKRGERVALLGRNGAGKTTLLKLLIGHIKASEGNIKINGSVQAMIHSNLGLHLNFTGRENIISALTYNNLNREEIRRAIEDIENFTELGDYLDQPMQSYSLGMQSRLQFAIASTINPDILIIDEMLGAGDAYFIQKSNKRIQKLIDNGCTLLLVSHNTQQVLQFCDRAMWLRSGKLFADGDVRHIVNSYDVYIERETQKRYLNMEVSEQTDKRSEQKVHENEDFMTVLDDNKTVFRWPAKAGVKISKIDLLANGKPSTCIRHSDIINLDIELKIEKEEDYKCRYIITIWNLKGKRIARIENDVDVFSSNGSNQKRNITINLSPLLLGQGTYTLNCAIYDMKNYSSTSSSNDSKFDIITSALDFTVIGNQAINSLTHINSAWKILN